MRGGFWTGVIVGVVGTWAFHKWVRPIGSGSAGG